VHHEKYLIVTTRQKIENISNPLGLNGAETLRAFWAALF
jgi:hypothetical protein